MKGWKMKLSRHHSLLWETMENQRKEKCSLRIKEWIWESVMCEKSISTPQHLS